MRGTKTTPNTFRARRVGFPVNVAPAVSNAPSNCLFRPVADNYDVLHIPMREGVESLNVGVAAGIALFHLAK